MKNNKNYSFRAILLNPLVLVVYGTTSYYLYSLLQYGGVKKKVPIILIGATILTLWFIWCFYKNRRKDFISKNTPSTKLWYYMALFIMLSTTVVTGYRIYQSGINYQGKLAWFIHDLKSKHEVQFIHDNIYEDSLNGLFADIREKITLPEELYVSNDFRLAFNNAGDIISFDTYLYGKMEDRENQSFLISYDRNKDKDITVRLNGYVNADYDENMKLQPLLDLIQWIPLGETVNNWEYDQYGIIYAGVRNWGYNTEGITYINKDEARKVNFPEEEIIGYTVSVYVPGSEDIITPQRFIHDDLKVLPKENEEPLIKWKVGYNYNKGEETFFLNESLGYKLHVADAALGSRFYTLLQTQDGGDTWETINPDPFLNNAGVSSGISFIDEKLGFIVLSHSAGANAVLYRTIDGGLSYEEISIPEIKVPLIGGQTYNPFDFPNTPYVENGKLYLSVSQGVDGDYNGGIKALYQSEYNGETWEYIREQD